MKWFIIYLVWDHSFADEVQINNVLVSLRLICWLTILKYLVMHNAWTHTFVCRILLFCSLKCDLHILCMRYTNHIWWCWFYNSCNVFFAVRSERSRENFFQHIYNSFISPEILFGYIKLTVLHCNLCRLFSSKFDFIIELTTKSSMKFWTGFHLTKEWFLYTQIFHLVAKAMINTKAT